MLATNKISWFYTSILYICGFFLFLEWLYPVKEITETNNLTVFIIYAIFCFCISMLQVNWMLSFILKGSGLFIIIHQLFFNQSILSTLRSEEHTSELQSRGHLVCRLLLEKKKQIIITYIIL